MDNYFEEDPEEKVGRYITGIFDEEVLVVMPRISWAYLDWLEQELNADVKAFFQQCEAVPLSEEERHEVYQNTVYKNFLQCEKAGLPRPAWCNPASQADFDDFEDRFSTAINEKDVLKRLQKADKPQ